MDVNRKLSKPRMTGARQVDLDGVLTTYFDQGRGETILLIYGGHFGGADAGGSAHVWDLTLPSLVERHRVIALDKLGQGATGNPLRDEDYSMSAVVRHVGTLMDRLDLKDVHLVGHSRGGFAATRLALEMPRRVRSLTVVSSGTLSPLPSPNEIRLSGSPHPLYTRESARFVYEHYAHDTRAVTDEWIDRAMEISALPRVPEAMDKMFRQGLYQRYFLPGLMQMKRETLHWLSEGRLQRPMQIIWGLNDRTAVVDGAFALQDIVSPHQSAEVHVFGHCGHYPFREHPAQFNQLLDGFVARAAARAEVVHG